MSTPNNSSQNNSSTQIPAVTRTRSARVALRSAAPGGLAGLVAALKRDNLGICIVLMFLTSVAICCVIGVWNVPFRFRLNSVTDRAIVCNVPFTVSSLEAKRLAIDRARWEAPHVFVNDSQPLVEIRKALWNTVAALVNARSYDYLDERGKKIWLEFLTPNGKGEIPPNTNASTAFDAFAAYFKEDTDFSRFDKKLQIVFTPFVTSGILTVLPYGPERGSQETILVYRSEDSPDRAMPFKVSEVLIRDGALLREGLQKQLNNQTVADQLFNWLLPRLVDTLKDNPNATAEVEQSAADAVKDVMIDFSAGQMMIDANEVLGKEDIALLRTEYNVFLEKRTFIQKMTRFSSICSVLFVLLLITSGFVRRMERRRPRSIKSFIFLMLSMIITVAAAQSVHRFSLTNAEGEILPLALFVMGISITYSWELAIVLATILSLVLVSGNGGGFDLFVILLGVTVSVAIQLGRLRSRKKLVIVGFVSGIIAFVLTISAGVVGNRLTGQPLLIDAVINFSWSLLAGLIMTGLLPFIERPFGILTDMSLLELGDISQPLLQSLVRLAPATYGHCMQVGTIAETAAEAVGARGLLTRVGAYFHDIGKIMKPEYYSENQGGIDNIHDHIEPQVSTIVLIAHVKDGVDLAKQHQLPKPLIDLIEQHHGTSLVSFFYGRAAKGGKDDVEESTFRYPGPKPQTKEAAILMIADSCESACRSMGAGASPGKIENRVRVIIKQKLDDGQFDDSGLMLNELKIIENSVIKSVIAAMHGRIQYPDQEQDGKMVKESEIRMREDIIDRR